MNLTFARLRLPTAALVVLASAVASAQTTTTTVATSSGSFPITLGNDVYANLSAVDCKNNATVQIPFTWIETWVSGQIAEYFLSNDTSCTPPTGAPITVANTTNVATNVAVETLNPLPQPSDGRTTDSDSTTNLTVGGIWAYESDITASGSSTTAQLTYKPGGGDCSAVVDSTVYLCIGLQQPATGTTTAASYTFAYFPFTLDSEQPASPGAPTVASLDSGLAVSWTTVTNAVSYVVHVQDEAGNEQGKSPVTVTGGGVSTQVYGLTNGVQYNVFLNALDNAGSDPPSTANVSANSPTVQGIPLLSLSYFQELTSDGAKEKGGCSSTGGSVPALLLALGLLWRRRRRPALVALFLTGLLGGGPARADEPPPETHMTSSPNPLPPEQDPYAPVVRQPSPEWFRAEILTGPFNPNPDKSPGLTGATPFSQFFPSKNNLLWRAQFHVNFLSLFGHESIGLGGGFWQTSGHAIHADGTQAGDVEQFNLIPITLMLGYRADFIYSQFRVPLIPYVKVGYGLVVYADTKDGNVTTGYTPSGQKWISEGLAGGFEFAGGLEFPLDFFDQRRAANLDTDFGINSTGIFGEAEYTTWTGFNGGLLLGGWIFSGGVFVAF